MGTLLIAGAAGTIGRELTARLAAEGVPFEVMSSRHGAGPGTRVADYADAAALARAFEGVQTLFVVLPLVPHKLALAANVAQAARQAGVQHIVRASGAGADPRSPWALPRLQGQVDKLLEGSSVPCSFLLNAGFMQNYLSFSAAMVRAGTLRAATADQPQSLVDVRDIAAVAAGLLRNPAPHAGRRYTLTGGESLTDTQRAAVFGQVLGRPVGFEAQSPDAVEAQMRGAWRMPEAMVELLGSLNRLVIAGHAAAISPDVTRLLGREPIGFAQFVADHRAAWAA